MAEKTLKSKIQLRNDTAAKWAEINPVLLKGEIGIEIDTRQFKIGDGTETWSNLSYANITDLSNYFTQEQTRSYVLTQINSAVSSVFKYKGSLDSISDLPTSDVLTGYVYNIKTEFTTTDNFTEGAGYKYGAGTNVVYGQNSKWDVLAGLVDLSPYATTSALNSGLANKVDKVSGQGLSTNDLTAALKANYDLAYKNQHTHSNSAILDNLEDTDISAARAYQSRSTKIIDTDDIVILNCGDSSGY